MAATESDIIRDEQERSSLLRAISDVEAAMAASTPGTRRVLETTVDNARKRITTLDKKIEEAKVEHAAELQAQTVAAELAAKETKLNAREQETYRGFLEESYFTKKDFGKLDQFYEHSYDRLSEGGKDEMSHRIWEGVRHRAYRFDDLPNEIREKEARRVYDKVSVSSPGSDIGHISAVDLDEFLQAYRTGDQKAAAHILNRDSFTDNLSLKTSGGAKHKAATAGRESDDDKILAGKPSPTSAPPESSAMSEVKQSATALGGVALIDTGSDPSVAALPNAFAPGVSGRSPA